MKNHVFVAVACLFLAACSDGGETKVAKLEAIPLGVAFENQTELKTSDCFKKIRYVAWKRPIVAWWGRERMQLS